MIEEITDIIINLDVIRDFAQDIPDKGHKNSALTLIKMCKKKLERLL